MEARPVQAKFEQIFKRIFKRFLMLLNRHPVASAAGPCHGFLPSCCSLRPPLCECTTPWVTPPPLPSPAFGSAVWDFYVFTLSGLNSVANVKTLSSIAAPPLARRSLDGPYTSRARRVIVCLEKNIPAAGDRLTDWAKVDFGDRDMVHLEMFCS